MKRGSMFLFLLLFFCMEVQAQENDSLRFIEVTGSAEMSVEPDEILFIMRIKEFWEEEFQEGKKPEDYKTKVPIAVIEKELMNDLNRIGIKEKDIRVQNVGDYWRERGRDFMISKQLELRLTDFSQIDQIIACVDTRGIDYMNIGELRNKNLSVYRKEVKTEALKSAQEKAEYLLSGAGFGKRIKDVIFIKEPEEEMQGMGYVQSYISNASVSGSGDSGRFDNLRKIKLRYEMRVRFEIE